MTLLEFCGALVGLWGGGLNGALWDLAGDLSGFGGL